MSETEKIVASLGILIAAYPNFDLKVETIRVYKEMLKDLDAQMLEQAVLAHIATSKFFPTISELRDKVSSLVERACQVPPAAEAWGEVMQKIRTIGHTLYGGSVPEFSHPLIGRIVFCLGWNDLCLSENSIADRARFIQAYEVELNREREDLRFLPETHAFVEKLQAGEVAEQVKQLAGRWREIQ
jgi:hypothetical protein